MRLAPVSGDLVVKLALGAAAVGLLVYLVKRAKDGLPSVQDVANAFNPASDSNLAYRATNAIGNAVADTAPTANGRNADGSWTLGGWFYDLTHGGQVDPNASTGGATGSW